MMLVKIHSKFWIKTSIVYGILALSFSFIGFIFDDEVSKDFRVGDQILASASSTHIIGHIIWGMIVAIPILAIRYIVATGLFAIALDADHLIQFFGVEMISRMGHSIPFALIAAVVMMFIFGKKDYLLGVVSFTAVLAHISWDILLSSGAKFPILFPFYPEPIVFGANEWIIILISAIIIVFSVKFVNTRLEKYQK